MIDDLMVYLKTTDTCQLNCNHCFTNGSNGKKGFFDVPKTIEFFHKLKEYRPYLRTGNISFHGGLLMTIILDGLIKRLKIFGETI